MRFSLNFKSTCQLKIAESKKQNKKKENVMEFQSGKCNSHWLLKLDFITMFFVGGRRYGIYSSFEIKVKYKHTIRGRVEEHFSVNVLLTNKDNLFL